MPRVEVAVDMPAPMVRRITLDRPEILNAINDTMRAQLHEEVARALSDKRVRVIILDGAGANFSAGGDIRFMQTLDRDALIAFHGRLLDLCRLIGSAEKPVVAAVRGVCAGGALGIALACDQLVATASTHFLIPFLRNRTAGCTQHHPPGRAGAGGSRPGARPLRPSLRRGRTRARKPGRSESSRRPGTEGAHANATPARALFRAIRRISGIGTRCRRRVPRRTGVSRRRRGFF